MIATIGHIDFGSDLRFSGRGYLGMMGRTRIINNMRFIKKEFIKYWKRIIKVINPYKEKCQTFVYVFIRPINHIRTLFKLY